MLRKVNIRLNNLKKKHDENDIYFVHLRKRDENKKHAQRRRRYRDNRVL
jgi:hypothetical protein